MRLSPSLPSVGSFPMHRPSPQSIAAILIAAMLMGSTLLTPLYLLYQRAFGFSEVTLTLIYAVYVLGNLCALFFFGRLSDQIGRRRASLPAMGLAAVATLVFLGADSTVWLVVGRVLSGLAIGIASGTAAAWIAELVPGDDKAGASALAAIGNLAGIGVGPLLAGVLAQYAPAPLAASYVVYLVVLAFVAWQVALLPETVARPARRLRDLSFRVRLGVPREISKRFLSPAVAAFATFALGGYYAALAPGLLSQDLGLASPAIAGAVVAELFLVAALAVVATRRLQSAPAMLSGLALLVPSVGCLLGAQSYASLALLIVGTLIGGIAMALGYRGTLQVINEIAPASQRAEVISSYLIVCYLGNSLPVIGVGVLAAILGHRAAHDVFAATIAALAAVAFISGWHTTVKR